MKFDIPLVALPFMAKNLSVMPIEGNTVFSRNLLHRRLPKTRFGKIMRRLLQDIASGQKVSGDTSTLEDRGVPDKLREDA